MTKKKRKKSEKKRNLKYGIVPGKVQKSVTLDKSVKQSSVASETINPDFKKELRKNLIYVGAFFIIIVILYFVLTNTNALDSILSLVGMNDLY